MIPGRVYHFLGEPKLDRAWMSWKDWTILGMSSDTYCPEMLNCCRWNDPKPEKNGMNC